MSRASRSMGLIGLTAMFTMLPAITVAQQKTRQLDSNSCPPGVLTSWEILASGVTPYGLMGASMSADMMSPVMVDRDFTMGMPDRGLLMEVMQYQPNRVLGLQEQLELSTKQVSKLEELITDRGNAEQTMRINMQAAINQLQKAVEAEEPDTAAVRRDALSLAGQRDALYAELVVNAAASRKLLTDQQREELLNGPCSLQHMHSPGTLGRRHQ
jgi:Spy/CpxP family protein refolding chaperone